jgi:hypothetical protein
MVVSLGLEGTLVTGTNTEPVTWTQHRRCVLWTCVSSVSRKGDASLACASPLSRRKVTLVVYACLLCLDERRHVLVVCISSVSTKGSTSRAHRSILVTTFYYIEGPIRRPERKKWIRADKNFSEWEPSKSKHHNQWFPHDLAKVM